MQITSNAVNNKPQSFEELIKQEQSKKELEAKDAIAKTFAEYKAKAVEITKLAYETGAINCSIESIKEILELLVRRQSRGQSKPSKTEKIKPATKNAREFDL